VGFNAFEMIELRDLDLTAADFRRTARPAPGNAAAREPGARQE
jgi:hypothetical protein